MGDSNPRAQEDLRSIAQNWEVLGAEDPLWAVCWDPSAKGGRWDQRRFYETGVRDLEEMLDRVRDAAGGLPGSGRALDFGCGVGRLTAALSRYFDRVDGVDVAESMVAKARAACPDSCVFHVNQSPDLSLFDSGTFDLVVTRIVLQHLTPPLVLSYVREFVRVLKPGGIAVFDVPNGYKRNLRGTIVRVVPNSVINVWRRLKNPGGAIMEVHVTPEEAVRSAVREAGGEVLAAAPIGDIPSMPLTKLCYVVRRAT